MEGLDDDDDDDNMTDEQAMQEAEKMMQGLFGAMGGMPGGGANSNGAGGMPNDDFLK